MNRCAALSGYGNVATPASRRMRSPAAISSPPIQLARIGLPVPVAYGTTCCAVRVGIGHRLGREDDEQAVAAGIARHDVESRRVALGRRVPDDVDRVARGSRSAGSTVIERRHRLGRELREPSSPADERVGREHARPAGVA